ncbi:unnamed protein product, partial [Ectocarpus fasciculatus]
FFRFRRFSSRTTAREASRGQRWQPTPLSSRTPFGACRCRPRECRSTPFRLGTRDSARAEGRRARGKRLPRTRSPTLPSS